MDEKLICRAGLIAWLMLCLGLSACSIRDTSVSQTDLLQRPEFQASKLQYLADSRERLLNWHDNTDRVAYGLKGPVQSLLIETPQRQRTPEMPSKRRLAFQRDGRISRITYTGEQGELSVVHHYTNEGLLQGLDWVVSDKKQRSVVFEYFPNQKIKSMQHQNYDHNEVTYTQFSYQLTASGWFEIAKSQQSMDLPSYMQFQADNALLWSNKGGINNDPEALFYLSTRDQVTSSSIRHAYTPAMEGVGGYRYDHYPNGQLQRVASYSGHDNELFHATEYHYNELGLLSAEVKRVTGSSLFNTEVNEKVEYVYKQIDQYGNWLERDLRYERVEKTFVITQTRELQYYADTES